MNKKNITKDFNKKEVKNCKQNNKGICRLGSGKILCEGQVCIVKE